MLKISHKPLNIASKTFYTNIGVFVFPGPWPSAPAFNLYLTSPVSNLYLPAPTLNLLLPALVLNLCLPVLRFTFQVYYSYSIYLYQLNVYYMQLILKGTVVQIEKTLINDRLPVSKVSWKFRIPIPVKFAIFLKSNQLFKSFYCLFCL